MDRLRQYIRQVILAEETIAIGQCYPFAVNMAKDSQVSDRNDLKKFKVVHARVNDKFSSDFLTYALCQEEAQNHLKANTTGMASSQTNFTHDVLLRVPILSPPLPEQKKIASILTSVDEVIENTDIIQIGTKAMYDQGILRACAKVEKPVLLKRGFGTTLKEFVQAAEFILSGGNENVILCERGIRTFETNTRFTLDLCGVAWLQEHSNLPIVIDPSFLSKIEEERI